MKTVNKTGILQAVHLPVGRQESVSNMLATVQARKMLAVIVKSHDK